MSNWVAIAALFVSAISIFLTVVTITIQRAHNRKSLLPIGRVTLGDYENRISVRLSNDGVGPMMINKVVVNWNEQMGSALIDFMPAMPSSHAWTTFVRDISDRAIAPEKEITLLLLEGDPAEKAFVEVRQAVRRTLSKLVIVVEYRNVYGEQMPAVRQKLDWFGRTLITPGEAPQVDQ